MRKLELFLKRIFDFELTSSHDYNRIYEKMIRTLIIL